MNELSKVSVVLPSLDPDEKLIAVIDGLLEYGFSDIILVNDGSKPENLHYFEEMAAQHTEVTLLHHPVNRGKGAALKTAFTWFLENRPDHAGVVTVDGDNQHHPEDTRACSLHMLEHSSIVLGCRDFSLPQVPFRSRNGNRITSAVFKIFCGMTLSDTQTGLRAIPAKYLQLLTHVYGDRFEYETNMLLAMKEHSLPYDEVKIRTVYIEENKSSHFRAVRDSWRIYKLILAHFFRYTLSSITSAVVEIMLVALLTALLNSILHDPWLSYTVTGVSRVLSSVLNFFVNQRLVFHKKGNTGKAALRYYLLAVPQMLIQMLLTDGAYSLFGITEAQVVARTVIHVAVMTVLFIASFMIQQRWVFKSEAAE